MFIDTNVLVNSRIPHAPDHDIARARLEHALRGHEPLRISRQAQAEGLVIVTADPRIAEYAVRTMSA